MSGKKQAAIGIPVIIALIFFLWGIAACNNDNDSSNDTNDDYSYSNDSYDDSSDYEDYDTDSDYEEVSSVSLTTKEVASEYDIWNHCYIKTTVKITNSKNDGLTFYCISDKLENNIAITFLEIHKNVKVGDIITVSGYCNYYYGDYVYIEDAELERTDKSLLAGFKTKSNKKATKTKTIEPDTKEDIPNFYTDGQYKVGVDIPAGQYIAYPEYYYGYSGYFAITSDANGDDIISNDNFSGQRYLTVSDGQYLELSSCTAYSVSDKKAIDSSAGYLDEGQYKAGDDITEGLFIIYANDGESAYYCISSDANGDDIIANENFENQAYVYVESGQYLQVSDGLLYGSDNVKKVDTSSGYLEEGQYKVGIDISPGTYNVISTDSYGGYYCISSDANGDDIIANDNFDGNSYVTVQDGQYISLSGAKLKLN